MTMTADTSMAAPETCLAAKLLEQRELPERMQRAASAGDADVYLALQRRAEELPIEIHGAQVAVLRLSAADVVARLADLSERKAEQRRQLEQADRELEEARIRLGELQEQQRLATEAIASAQARRREQFRRLREVESEEPALLGRQIDVSVELRRLQAADLATQANGVHEPPIRSVQR